ncbi:hypothetical protein C8F04DRAFT_1062629 [Mycena alexandri]|uniref:Uncharacterized protein n=1 Tax=Mycena alexandri TaxID=1745969 RepID=A0AAD6TKN4_9AGAR|nr:hypothetical protein C8F04DRAFT_1062629 [Mycena alexandri]
MSSDIGGHNSNSALYQYGVPVAVFIFAAICITIYFRMSFLTDQRQRADPERDGRRGKEGMDPGMKPVLFETYLADGWWDPRLAVIFSAKEWEEIMPLSVANLDSSAASTTKDGVPDAKYGATDSNMDCAGSRVLVSVVICMPCAPVPLPRTSLPPSATTNSQEGEEETDTNSKPEPLPYLELGLVEVDVSRIGDGVPVLAVES